MLKLRSFFTLTVLGGMTVVLPIIILVVLFKWLFDLVTDFIQPLSLLLSAHANVQDLLADILVLFMLLAVCFGVGLTVKTRLGAWLHRLVDQWMSRLAPGYGTIRDLVGQFLGGSGQASLLSGKVALVQLYPNIDLRVTGIITAEYEEGYTVFVPTAPIPTSGMVYHVPKAMAEIRPDITVEQAMKTVITCGGGSQIFFNRSAA